MYTLHPFVQKSVYLIWEPTNFYSYIKEYFVYLISVK